MSAVGANQPGQTCTFRELLVAVSMQDASGEMKWTRNDLLHVLTEMSKTPPPKVTVVDGDGGPELETTVAITLFDQPNSGTAETQ